MGLAAVLSHDVDLLPLLIPRDTIRGVVGLTTVLQQQQQPLKSSEGASAGSIESERKGSNGR